MEKKKSSTVVEVGRDMELLEWQAIFVVGMLLNCSQSTREDTRNCLGNIGKFMQRQGLISIKEIGQPQVEKYFEELRDRGLSAGRMARHARAMRRLCERMGKPEIVPSNHQLGCSRS
jgi:site-specific recombinase XerD